MLTQNKITLADSNDFQIINFCPLLSLLDAVRLSNGTGRCSGRVEVYQDGRWGKICKNHFGLEEAGVVCKELDCGAPADFQDSFNYGETTLRGYTSRCIGNVSSISQCSLHEITGTCESVSLTCAGKSEFLSPLHCVICSVAPG